MITYDARVLRWERSMANRVRTWVRSRSSGASLSIWYSSRLDGSVAICAAGVERMQPTIRSSAVSRTAKSRSSTSTSANAADSSTLLPLTRFSSTLRTSSSTCMHSSRSAADSTRKPTYLPRSTSNCCLSERNLLTFGRLVQSEGFIEGAAQLPMVGH